MVICRAWQAELGKLGGGTGGSEGDLVVGRGSECWRETEAQACLPHPFQSLQSNSPSQGAASGLGSPPLKSISWPHSPAKETDGQTDVGHSCSPVRRLEQVWGSLELCSAVAGLTTPVLRHSLPAPLRSGTRGPIWSQEFCLVTRSHGDKREDGVHRP